MGAVTSTFVRDAGTGDLGRLAHSFDKKRYQRVLVKTNLSGETVWHIAASQGNVKALQALVAFVEVNSYDRDKFKRISEGVLRPCSTGRDLLEVMLNRQNAEGMTPLMCGAFFGHEEVVRLLLNKGADPWAADKESRRTALHFAALRGHPGCLRILLGPDLPQEHAYRNNVRLVDCRTSSGFTPLHYAAAFNVLDACEALLELGADLHAACSTAGYYLPGQCAARSTPLHIAACKNRIDIARVMLKYQVIREQRWRARRLIMAAGPHSRGSGGHSSGPATSAPSSSSPTPLVPASVLSDSASTSQPSSSQGQAQPASQQLPQASPSWGEETFRDARLGRNALGQMPYEVAARREYVQLTQLLHPAFNLRFMLGMGAEVDPSSEDAVPSLQVLAAEALRQRLMVALDAAEAAQQQHALQHKQVLNRAPSKSSCQALPTLPVPPPPEALLGPPFGGRFTANAASAAATSLASAAAGAAIVQSLSGLRSPEGSVKTRSSCDFSCGICFDAAPVACLRPCNHSMCLSCTRRLCEQIAKAPGSCPFCRGIITHVELSPNVGPMLRRPSSKGLAAAVVAAAVAANATPCGAAAAAAPLSPQLTRRLSTHSTAP